MARKPRRYKRFSAMSLERHPSFPNPVGLRELGYAAMAERLKRNIEVLPTPPMSELKTYIDHSANPPRMEVMDRVWQSMTKQKVVSAYKIPIIKQKNRALFLCVSGTQYFFISQEFFQGVYKKSIVYRSKDDAMQCYLNDRISWVEVHRVPVPVETADS